MMRLWLAARRMLKVWSRQCGACGEVKALG
jgi:hypothetical protein